MINNRYEVIKKIGEGRSCVYHCIDSKTNNSYALKAVSPSITEEEQLKFAGEYRIIKKLNHPGIIRAFEYGVVLETDYPEIPYGSRFIILELFNGRELAGLKNLSETDLNEIIAGIVSALQYMHLSNLIYYDLKPENVLVGYEEDKLHIKIIDLGFARAAENIADKSTRGTAEYIAPELLKNEPYDHRIDYYSLGILIYRMIYDAYPFDNSSEIKIFKSQIEDNFVFPANNYSSGINKVMQNLLKKEPSERYMNAMQILEDLEYKPVQGISESWIPALSYSGRKDALNILNNYLVNYSGGDIFCVRGPEGSGKTTLLKEFCETKKNIVYTDNAKNFYGIEFINDLLEKILYNENIYPLLENELRIRLKNFIAEPPHHIADEIRGIFSQLLRTCSFIMLIDDFNNLDELSQQIFREIIPLFQVQNAKIIITEDSDKPPASEFIHNLHFINLSPFTENQVQELLDKSLYPYFPKEELKKIILQYADLLPGSIEAFIKDLILFGIIKYTAESINIISDKNAIGILKQSHEYFYKLRIRSLNKGELTAAEYLSAFETLPDRQILAQLINEDADISDFLIKLRAKNILLFTDMNKIGFSSAGMKDYIYSQIKDKKKIHLQIASVLEKFSPLNSKEIALQYESAGEYNNSVNYYLILYNEALSVDAYAYQKSLLEKMLSFPLPEEQKNNLKFETCKVLLNSGDPVTALEHCDELLIFNSDPAVLNELLLLKGIALIRSGRSEEGIKQIEYLVDMLEDEERKNKLMTEIASAYLDINDYAGCEKICREIISGSPEAGENTGKCYNFLGLISIHRDNDFDKAYEYFKSAERVYSAAGLKFRTAQMLTNLGNIKNIKGENDLAEELWNSSLQLNSTMGNLQHEATVLLNFGVLNFMKLDYERSIEYYKKALAIFSSTGDQRGEGLVNHNLGELYYLSCEYGNSLKYLKEARTIFENLQDVNEELETLFLLGIFYETTGSKKDLGTILNDFQTLMMRDAGEKHKFDFRYLKLLLNRKSMNFFHEIKDIIRYYNKQSVKNNFFRASITAVDFLYEHMLYKEALEELQKESLVSAAGSNRFFKAERLLYIGLVTEQTGVYDVHPSEYYLEALELVENLSISELTWKIMMVLSIFYYNRGNYLRAEEYAYYTRSLIEHIAEGIGEAGLKKSYLARREILKALNMCKKILPDNG